MKTISKKYLCLRALGAFVFLVTLNACVTAPPPAVTDIPATPTAPTPEASNLNGPTTEADLDGLQHRLGLDSPNLGHVEKSFNTCEAGYGYSSSHNCRTMYFSVVNFQLQCRDSNGTVSDVNYIVTPVVSDQVKWTWGTQHGYLATNTEGFGRVRTIFPASGAQQRLRLTVLNDFLILRAIDVKRIVAPKEWCEHK